MVDIENNKEELHWFWKITSKWYFFPIFYVFLAFIVAFISAIKDKNLSQIWEFSLYSLVWMPNGLNYYPQYFDIKLEYNGSIFSLIFFGVSLSIIIIIQFFKIKYKKILKPFIIVLLILFILAFSGCVASLDSVLSTSL